MLIGLPVEMPRQVEPQVARFRVTRDFREQAVFFGHSSELPELFHHSLLALPMGRRADLDQIVDNSILGRDSILPAHWIDD